MGMEAAGRVAGDERDELRARDVAVNRRHRAKKIPVRWNRDDRADRLDGLAGGVVRKGLRDRGDQRVVVQNGPNFVLVDDVHCRLSVI